MKGSNIQVGDILGNMLVTQIHANPLYIVLIGKHIETGENEACRVYHENNYRIQSRRKSKSASLLCVGDIVMYLGNRVLVSNVASTSSYVIINGKYRFPERSTVVLYE